VMSVMVCASKYYSGHKFEDGEMGGACSMHGRGEICIQGLGREHREVTT
jgi:hypothetical protein